jgi:hypothetical protein
LRDHAPIVLEEFNGLWKRGDDDSVPIDHFSDCENVQYFQSGFETRDGLDTHIPAESVIRLFNYVLQSGPSLLILVEGGKIYHAIGTSILYGPILEIDGMLDFNMVSHNGRALITPITRFINELGETIETGMENEFVYIYKGDGTPARKAAGFPPTQDDQNPYLVVYNSSLVGGIDKGIHILAYTFTDGIGGYSSAVGPFPLPLLYAPGENQAYVQNIRDTTTPGVTHKGIWMSKAIDPSNYVQADAASLTGIYELFFVKNVPNGVGIESTIINAADVDLVAPFAAGSLPNVTAGGIYAENTSIEGHCDIGLHIVGVVYETDTGYLTAPGPENKAVQTYINENRAIKIGNIPVSPDSFVIRKHLVSTKALVAYNGDDEGYEFFFIPGGTIDNDVTELVVSYYDIELLDDASHLIDNFSEIPAGVYLATYNGRLVLTTTFTDISIAYVSFPNEPEAIDQVDGIIIVPLDGKPLTAAQEFRDVLYLFKQVRTFAVNDNGDVPSTWIPIAIDQGIGASIHGIAQVLDSGGVNIDYILVNDLSGVMMFNGAYLRPELSWKIADLWFALDRNKFGYMQILNDSLNQRIYVSLPDGTILYADYAMGQEAKSIKWAPWTFDIEVSSIALINTDVLIVGAS